MPMNLIEKVDQYYSEKIKQHGATSHGVDWNSELSQGLRYQQLSKVICHTSLFSILDFGCGYGYGHSWLKERYSAFNYIGYDISQEMINQAKAIQGSEKNVRFTTCLDLNKDKFDYVISSGVFNVKLDASEEVWTKYLMESIATLNEVSVKGFAFNLLSLYSDPLLRKSHLFYGDPLSLFDHCKKNISRKVSLIHDYDLYEFTILVNKT